jgi:hypothetical protein
MAIVINPNFEADCSKDDKGKKVWTRHFVLYDSENAVIDPNDAYAEAYDYATANDTYDDLNAKSLKVEEDGDGAGRVYRFTITYTEDGGLGGEDPQANTVVGTLRFSTKGHSRHIISSKQTIDRQSNPSANTTAPDFRGLINVQDGVAQGIDITTPCLHVDVTAQIPTTWVTANWLAVFYGLTGKVNSDALWAFPPHTLLFRGLDGSTNGSGACNLTFSFDFQPNVETTVAPFSLFAKNGWEYLWTYTELHTDTGSNTTQPVPAGLYRERVYDEVSFSAFNFIVIN